MDRWTSVHRGTGWIADSRDARASRRKRSPQQTGFGVDSAAWTFLVAGLVAWSTLVAPSPEDEVLVRGPAGLEGAVLVIVFLGLVLRHLDARAALLVCACAEGASVLWELPGGGYHYATLYLAFVVTAERGLRRAGSWVAAAVLGVYLGEVWVSGWRPFAFAPVWVLVSGLLALALGNGRHLHERLRRSLERQVSSSAAAVAAVAQARVAEDRLRIARDLHDAVGHHLAVVHLSAAAARRALLEDEGGSHRRGAPGRTEPAEVLAGIDQAAAAALTEIDSLLRRLRDEGGVQAPVGADVAEVVAEFRRCGLDVRAEGIEELGSIGEHMALAAGRSLQELLTNALKHGKPEVPVRVMVARSQQELRMCVSNAAAPTAGPGTGHGLQGLRERLTEEGGHLEISRGRNFEVSVVLPERGEDS
ncbi:sensor histidine kinase [Nocardioides bruguierae]|uniref:sensor histidine kinase n=1 Tax=Nocardioides bruguierae TaxID=2945102 RepID=UPI0020215B14|nr:histidine kinase [Nocardioides bruguierae]